MSTVSEISAEIARLVADGADYWTIAGARERRAVAERRVEEFELASELEDLVAAARGFKGKRLSALAVRRIVERLYGADVLEATHASPYRAQPKGRIERVSREIAASGAESSGTADVLAHTRQVQNSALHAAALNRRGRKA